MSIRIDASTDLVKRTASVPDDIAFTACCWMYVVTDRTSNYRYAIALERAGGTDWIVIGWNNTDNFQISYSNGAAGQSDNFAANPSIGAWIFLAITSSGTASGTLNGYWRTINGSWNTIASTGARNAWTPDALTFGNDGFSEWINGRFAAMKVWDATLTQAELEAEMYSVLPVRFANLHACWPGFSSGELQDWSGNAKSLTAGGTLSTEDGPPIAIWPAWEDPTWQGHFTSVAGSAVAPATEDRRPRFKRTPARTPLGRRFLRPTIQAPTLNDANIAPNTSDENVTAAHDRFGWSPSRRPMQRRALRPSKAATDFIFTPAAGQTIAIGQATETDTAQPIAWAPKNRLVNQVLETDTAQAVAHLKLKALGQVLETDLAQPLAHAKVKAIGQCTETDTAQPIAWAPKNRLVNQALETDLAQPITRQGHQVIAANQATETDTAQPIAWAPKKRLVAQVAETDLAQSITRVKRKTLGIPIETDLAQALTRQKAKTLGQVFETDVAQALVRLKRKGIGQATETDLALSIVYTVFLVDFIQATNLQAAAPPGAVGIQGLLPTASGAKSVGLPTATNSSGVL